MEPCARPVVMGRCFLHGRVRANRSLWRVRNRLHAGSGRFPCPVRRPETPSASACSTQGGDTAGITHGAATLGSRTGVRPVTAYHGRSSNPMRGMPDQRRTGMQARRSSPTQQWAEFPESPRAALAPVRRGDGRRCIPRIRGVDPGHPSNHAARRTVAPGASPFGTGDRGGAGRCVPSHPRGGRASPSCRDRLAA